MTNRLLTIDQWTEFLKQGKRRSKLKVPHLKQANLISYLFRPDGKLVKQVDLCCGRGFGKSVFAIFVATMALSLSPDEIGLFLEPDWKRVRRVFLKKWIQIVPSHLYTLNKSEQCITWLPTGSMLFYGPRNITGAQGAADDSQLGQDTTFIIDDEAALRCSKSMYINNMATIREPSNVRFYLTTSTPRIGPYEDLVTSEGHKLFRGTSHDNPYLPEGYVELLRSQMSKEQAEREIEGRFVALEGRIWKYFDDENLHDHEHDPSLPFFLFFDLGVATAAFVIAQRIRKDWVITAEYTPHRRQGSMDHNFARIRQDYGVPASIVAGADLESREHGSGKKNSWYVTKHFGQIPRVSCTGWRKDKEIQYAVLSYLICDADDRRRLFISKHLRSHDETGRGVMDVMKKDTWPEDDKASRFSDMLIHNNLSHMRDALLYGAVCKMAPPDYSMNQGFSK